ncbi:hypothetical protein Tsubulata_011734 [Turnera subulata]|uniref:RING-type domain-containing protein n=1 Tax=Turnera subulata TaxID=218843 RepID=A0A9Q0JM66_9ROSI|nr:hypothetical protein Tsubulata_011734 [Turnera subulata]
MISIMYSQSSICMATLLFYTCILIPLRQIKHALTTIITQFSCGYDQDDVLVISCNPAMATAAKCCHLPAAASLGDVVSSSGNTTTTGGTLLDNETCSICLVDLQSEDVVSRLPRCNHLFHTDCIRKWIERDQFTCPLCRSIVFSL